MSTPIDARVAFFLHLRAKGRNVPLREILDGIQSGRWAGEIAKLRADGRESPGYEKKKARLPSFTLSATTNAGRKAADVIEHSGLIQVDVDKVGQADAPNLRDRLGDDQHILAAWISPSGDGVKAAFCVPADLEGHEAAFRAVAEYLRDKYGVTIDPACSDVCRQCFVSHDSGLILNEACQPLAVASAQAGLGRGAEEEGSSTSLPSTSYILHNSSLFTDWPALRPLYAKLVHEPFPVPQPRQRNRLLCALVPRLFGALIDKFVLAFAEEYYHQHSQVFATYDFEEYRRQAVSLLNGCHSSYPARLSCRQKDAYSSLSTPQHQAAFRICQSLARIEKDPSHPPPLFHLSAHHLGVRLDLLDMEAWRILRALESSGVIAVEKPGCRRAKGKTPISTTYRWLLAEAETPHLPPCQP